MEKHAFGEFLMELCIFFERRPVSVEVMAQWYETVRDIPGKYLGTIGERIRSLDSWPKNLPGYMRRVWGEIQGADNPKYKIHDRCFHPERYAKKDCAICQGTGLYDLHLDWPVAKVNGKLITKPVVRRALCTCTDAAEYGF